MAQPEDINVHGARRFLGRIIANRGHEVELVDPDHTTAVDRIFGPKYVMSVKQQKITTLHPTVHPDRREQLVEAARSATVAAKKRVRKTNKNPKTKQSRKTRALVPSSRISALERRVEKLEKSSVTYKQNIKVISKDIKPLEHIVERVEELGDLHETVENNFKKAEKIMLRDERMLKRLRDDVKTELRPQLKLHDRDIAKIKVRLEKLETLHSIFANIEGEGSVKLKELGERIFVTKQQLKKLQTNE